VARQHDAVEVERELIGVGVGAEVSLGDARAEDLGEGVEPVALVADQAVAHRSRLVVQLARRGHEQAAARFRVPAQPVLEDRADPGLAAGGGQCRRDHLGHEPGPRVLEDLELQGLLRAEVRVEPALGQFGVGGEGADGHAAEADRAREGAGGLQDGLLGGLALAHAAHSSTIVRLGNPG
jgi:hypothetical protein